MNYFRHTFLMVLFFFFSCSDSTHDLDSRLFGSWYWVETVAGHHGFDSPTTVSSPSTLGCNYVHDFQTNGAFTNNGFCVGDTFIDTGTWYVKNHNLVLTINQFHESRQYDFSGDTLRIIHVERPDGIEYDLWSIEKWLKQ